MTFIAARQRSVKSMVTISLDLADSLFEALERHIEVEGRGESPSEYVKRLVEEGVHRREVEQWEADFSIDDSWIACPSEPEA